MNVCDICHKIIPNTNTNKKLINGKSYTLCGKHYSQFINNGYFLDKSKFSSKDPNKYCIDNSIVYIYTTDIFGNNTGYFIIDEKDFLKIIIHKWRCRDGRYYTNIKINNTYVPIEISRFLFQDDINILNFEIDHINHKPWDNRRCNLRIVKHSENLKNQKIKSSNSSGFSGIWFDKYKKKWVSEIKYNYIKCFLGRYDELSDAVYVRYFAEYILFGEYRDKCNDNNIINIIKNVKNKRYLESITVEKIYRKYSKLNKECIYTIKCKNAD